MNLIRFLFILLIALPAYGATTGGIAIPSLPSTNRANSPDLLVLESRTVGTNSRTTKITVTNFADSLTNFGFSKGAAGTTLTNLGAGTRLLTNNGIKSLTTDGTVTITDNGTSIAFSAPTNGGVNASTVTNIVRGFVSTNVFNTSSILGSGSASLENSSTTYGSDSGALLQGLLDQATNGPIKIIVDGRYSSGRSLTIRSNTELYGLPGCGIILRSNVNNSLLKNASWGSVTNWDSNIKLSGSLILNGGGYNMTGTPLQTHSSLSNHWHCTLSFDGTEGLIVEPGVRIVGPRTFAGLVSRAANAYIEGSIDVGTNAFFNQDGWHVLGPSTNLFIGNLTARTYDDAVGINANDLGTNCTTCPLGTPIIGILGINGGPIVGARIHNIFLKKSNFGIRLLSSSNLVTDIDIDGLYGETKHHAVLLDNYAEANTDLDMPGNGNFGMIRMANVRATVTYGNYYQGTIYVNGRGRQITIEGGQSQYQDNLALSPYLYMNTNSYWNTVRVSGLSLMSPTNNELQQTLIFGGSMGVLNISDNQFYRSNSSSLFPIQFFGNVGSLVLQGNQAFGFPRLVKSVDETFDNIITNAMIGANYVYSGLGVADYATNLGGGVYNFGSGIGTQVVEKNTGNDDNDGTIGADFYQRGPVGVEFSDLLLATRTQGAMPWFIDNVRRNYSLDLNQFDTGFTFRFLLKDSDTTDRVLLSTSITPASPLTNMWLRAEFDTYDVQGGVVLRGRLKRLSDNYYMTSNGTWTASLVNMLEYIASGTNYWRPPVPGIAWGYASAQTTNGWMTISNVVFSKSMDQFPQTDLTGLRQNIGALAGETALGVGTIGTQIRQEFGDRSAVYIDSPTNGVGMSLGAVNGGASSFNFLSSDTFSEMRFYVGSQYKTYLDTNAGFNSEEIRAVGTSGRLEIVQQGTPSTTNRFFNNAGRFFSVTYPNNITNFTMDVSGDFNILSNLTSAAGSLVAPNARTNVGTIVAAAGWTSSGELVKGPVSSGAGSQTPWTSDIDGGGNSLTNVNNVTLTGTFTIPSLVVESNTFGVLSGATNLGSGAPFATTTNLAGQMQFRTLLTLYTNHSGLPATNPQTNANNVIVWIPTNAPGSGGSGSGDMFSQLLSNRVVEVSNRTFTAADLYTLHVLTNGTTNLTLTLPTGVEGAVIGFRVVSSATNLFTLSSTSLIDGETNRVMWATESATLLFDGGTWTKVDGKSRPMTCIIRLTTNVTGWAIGTPPPKVPFNNIYKDSSGKMANIPSNRVDIVRKGQYSMIGKVEFANMPANKIIQSHAYISGALTFFSKASLPATEYPAASAIQTLDLNAGQYVELYAVNGDTSTQTLSGDASFLATYIQVLEVPSW